MMEHTNGHAAFDAVLDHLAGTPPAPSPAKPRRPRATTVYSIGEAVTPTPEPAAVEPAPAPQPAITTLADDAASLTHRLARSLGVPAGADPSPGVLVAAVERVHAALTQARADLGAWADQIEERERALEAREKAVGRREAEAEGCLRLAGLTAPGGRPARRSGWLARLLRRR